MGWEITTEDIAGWVGSLIWPFVRIGALFMAMPLLGARLMPVRLRLVLALALSVLVAPLIPAAPAVDPISLQGLLVTLWQVLLGVAMGFIFHLVFGALVLAGQNIAMSIGLGFASAADPQNGVQVPIVSQYFMVVGTLLFLALNGHLMVIHTLVESFRLLPVNLQAPPGQLPAQIALWGGRMFAGSVLIALPVMVSALFVNLAFGVMTRTAPQLNIFAVGFPVTLLVGLVMILLSLPSLLPGFESLLSQANALLLQVLR